MEKKCRKRLRPWLERHLDSNTYQSLKWMDRNTKLFRISWKHQNNRNWDANADSEIFKGWAEYSGKFKEGDPINPPEWKTRLRTALTKLSDVEEMRDYHNLNDPDDPYKVYRFLDDEEVANKIQQQATPASEFGADSSPGMSSQTSPMSQIDFLELQDTDEPFVQTDAQHGNISNIPTVVYDCGPRPANSKLNNVNVIEPYRPNIASNHDPSTLPLNIQHESVERNVMPHHISRFPSDLVNLDFEGVEGMVSSENSAMDLGSLPNPDSINFPIMKIKFNFVEQCILETSFDARGARVFCGNLPHIDPDSQDYLNLFGPNTLLQICIPAVDNQQAHHLTGKQKDLIRDIQKNMRRGLVFEYKENKLYAKRLCKARVFAWNSEGSSVHLDRYSGKEMCVFDLTQFKYKLSEFLEDKNARSPPSPSVCFCFGQEYKSDQSCKRKFLLHVEIIHIEAESLLNDVMNDLQDSDLLISDANVDDLLASLKSKMSFEENTQYLSDCVFQN